MTFFSKFSQYPGSYLKNFKIGATLADLNGIFDANKFNVCQHITYSLKAGQEKSFKCALLGSTLGIWIEGSGKTLSLCEVEVFAANDIISPGKYNDSCESDIDCKEPLSSCLPDNSPNSFDPVHYSCKCTVYTKLIGTTCKGSSFLFITKSNILIFLIINFS